MSVQSVKVQRLVDRGGKLFVADAELPKATRVLLPRQGIATVDHFGAVTYTKRQTASDILGFVSRQILPYRLSKMHCECCGENLCRIEPVGFSSICLDCLATASPQPDLVRCYVDACIVRNKAEQALVAGMSK